MQLECNLFKFNKIRPFLILQKDNQRSFVCFIKVFVDRPLGKGVVSLAIQRALLSVVVVEITCCAGPITFVIFLTETLQKDKIVDLFVAKGVSAKN